ncbi:hypothetical protein [Rhodophyticola porphyridii]|uniref:hypothetical protein n=1 Tax=Rhodophyticola porphyridii TaxID=1852017 RepID=UPI0035CEF7EF
MKKTSLIVVVDGPGLEAMSLLLVASLHRQHADLGDMEIVAYVTPETLANLGDVTLARARAGGPMPDCADRCTAAMCPARSAVRAKRPCTLRWGGQC